MSTLHYLVVPIPVVDAVEQLATVADTLELGPVLVVTLQVKLQGKAGLQQVTTNLAFVPGKRRFCKHLITILKKESLVLITTKNIVTLSQ